LVEKFKDGCICIVDELHSRRRIEVSTDALKDCAEEMTLSDHRINNNEISEALNVSVGTVHKIIHNTSQFSKKCACWVPKMLTESHKQSKLQICLALKEHFDREGENFVQRITSHETWIHHHKPKLK
jgi:plasmid maintenance system antidote protein VapI